MAVCIRLKRDGRKHLPFYHICVFNSRSRRDGRPIEQVGFYDPASNAEEKVRLDVERVKYWLAKVPSQVILSLVCFVKKALPQECGAVLQRTRNAQRLKVQLREESSRKRLVLLRLAKSLEAKRSFLKLLNPLMTL